jgi:hypothetical protein
MCIILPVSHLPCTHTISIWQYCNDATPSGAGDTHPCWDVRFHERPILTKKLCGDCNAPRLFARRGGIAERGDGSPLRIPEAYANAKEDDANDSGYHSDVIHEEDECSDLDECPLSPKAMAPPQARPQSCRARKRVHRSLTRKPSWRPNLKRELSKIRLEDTAPSVPRRESIDSLLSRFDDSNWNTARVEVGRTETKATSNIRISLMPAMREIEVRKGRTSTLLHPSSPPPMETTGQAQMAKSFPFPQVVDLRRPPSRQSSAQARRNSTLLHPSSPDLGPTRARPVPETFQSHKAENITPPKRRPAMHMRRESSLLHPSSPPSTATTPSPDQIPTIISIPPSRSKGPVKRPSTLLHPSRPQTSPQRPVIPPRCMPRLQTTVSEPQSATMARRRRASVLHSCLSDSEDGSEDERPSEVKPTGFEDVRARLQAFSFQTRHAQHQHTNPSLGPTHGRNQDHIDASILANTAEAARANRHGPRGERM